MSHICLYNAVFLHFPFRTLQLVYYNLNTSLLDLQ